MKKSELKELIKECLNEAQYRDPEEWGHAIEGIVEELAAASKRAARKGDPAAWGGKYHRSAPGFFETAQRLIKILDRM